MLITPVGLRYDDEQLALFEILSKMDVTSYVVSHHSHAAVVDACIKSGSPVEGWMHLHVEWRPLKAGLKFVYASSSHNYPGHTMSHGFHLYEPAKRRSGDVNPHRATFLEALMAVNNLQNDFDNGCTNSGCSGLVHRR